MCAHRPGRRKAPTAGRTRLRQAKVGVEGRPVTSPSGQHERPPEGAGGPVPLAEATRAWFAISLQTFGGPAGQIAVMQHALVDERRWIGQKRCLHALSFCTLLPGPEAQQLAIYIGWLLNGTLGGLIAGVLFVLPGVLALLGLSALYVAAGDTTVVTAVLAAVAPAVLVIVAQAVLRVGGRALGHPALVAVAVAAFVALSVFKTPFPIVVVIAAAIGWALGRWAPQTMHSQVPHADASEGRRPLISDDQLHAERPSRTHALKVIGVGLVAWAVPVGAVVALAGGDSIFADMALFFTGAALITFGGAYAVLAYVAQKAVQYYGWLTPSEMITGLALAETTPGPLIMVVQFVAFVGAYHDPGSLNPWVAAVAASLLTTWVTIVPCFVFVFVGAPYVERLRGNHSLSAALTGIMAAVVGVIANLAIYFAIHTLFRDVKDVTWGPVQLQVPEPGSLKPLSLAVAAFAALLLFPARWSVLRTLGACALVGLVIGLVQALAI
jgi:chromate transporter